jgi:hypothetical protein
VSGEFFSLRDFRLYRLIFLPLLAFSPSGSKRGCLVKTLMACVYHVINKAEKLGDVAYKIYQVLRNRLGGLYTKMKWGGKSNGAKITGAGDPLDVWDDFLAAVNPYEISGGNGNEIVAKFRIGGNEFILKFYPVSSSDGTPTISVRKGNFEFKMRF